MQNFLKAIAAHKPCNPEVALQVPPLRFRPIVFLPTRAALSSFHFLDILSLFAVVPNPSINSDALKRAGYLRR